jgi:hypothetical protein
MLSKVLRRSPRMARKKKVPNILPKKPASAFGNRGMSTKAARTKR